MRLGRVIVCAAVLAVTAGPARAVPSLQTFTVINQAHVRHLAAVERALVAQAHQLRAHWGTPLVRFGPGGWVITLSPTAYPKAGGYHGTDTNGQPDGLVFMKDKGIIWSQALSHEVMEILVDPYNRRWEYPHRRNWGRLIEVCDPVAYSPYTINGVTVEDFVFPNWLRRGSRGPWDQDKTAARAGDATYGVHMPIWT